MALPELGTLLRRNLQDLLQPHRKRLDLRLGKARLPLRLPRQQLLLVAVLLLLHRIELCPERFAACVLLVGTEFEHRLVRPSSAFPVAEGAAQLVDAVEEREELVELALGDGIVLVVVAPGAA